MRELRIFFHFLLKGGKNAITQIFYIISIMDAIRAIQNNPSNQQLQEIYKMLSQYAQLYPKENKILKLYSEIIQNMPISDFTKHIAWARTINDLGNHPNIKLLFTSYYDRILQLMLTDYNFTVSDKYQFIALLTGVVSRLPTSYPALQQYYDTLIFLRETNPLRYDTCLLILPPHLKYILGRYHIKDGGVCPDTKITDRCFPTNPNNIQLVNQYCNCARYRLLAMDYHQLVNGEYDIPHVKAYEVFDSECRRCNTVLRKQMK